MRRQAPHAGVERGAMLSIGPVTALHVSRPHRPQTDNRQGEGVHPAGPLPASAVSGGMTRPGAAGQKAGSATLRSSKWPRRSLIEIGAALCLDPIDGGVGHRRPRAGKQSGRSAFHRRPAQAGEQRLVARSGLSSIRLAVGKSEPPPEGSRCSPGWRAASVSGTGWITTACPHSVVTNWRGVSGSSRFGASVCGSSPARRTAGQGRHSVLAFTSTRARCRGLVLVIAQHFLPSDSLFQTASGFQRHQRGKTANLMIATNRCWPEFQPSHRDKTTPCVDVRHGSGQPALRPATDGVCSKTVNDRTPGRPMQAVAVGVKRIRGETLANDAFPRASQSSYV